MIEIITNSWENTCKFAYDLSKKLRPGSVIALTGELGAGKTHFVKGLALGLKVSDDQVISSPTFTLINEYSGTMPIYHVDFYRLNSVYDLDTLGLEEYFSGNGITVIEWADKFPKELPSKTIWIQIEVIDENHRRIILGDVSAPPTT